MRIALLLWQTLRRTLHAFFAGNGLFLASGFAFNLLLYCMPLALLLIAIGGYTFIGSERTIVWINETWGHVMPTTQENLTASLTNIADHREVLGFTGLLLYFILSSTVFGTARIVLNAVLRTPSQTNFLHSTLRDVVMMIGVPMLMIVTIVADMILSIIRVAGERVRFLHDLISHGWLLLGQGMGFVFVAVVFYLCYRFLPDRVMSHKALIVGSVIGAGLFEVSRWAFDIYVSAAQTIALVYGALGGMIFFFFWLYYAACVFILGAVAGAAYEDLSRAETVVTS